MGRDIETMASAVRASLGGQSWGGLRPPPGPSGAQQPIPAHAHAGNISGQDNIRQGAHSSRSPRAAVSAGHLRGQRATAVTAASSSAATTTGEIGEETASGPRSGSTIGEAASTSTSIPAGKKVKKAGLSNGPTAKAAAAEMAASPAAAAAVGPPKRRRGRPKGARKLSTPVPLDAGGVASLLWRLASEDEELLGTSRIQPHGLEAVVPPRSVKKRPKTRPSSDASSHTGDAGNVDDVDDDGSELVPSSSDDDGSVDNSGDDEDVTGGAANSRSVHGVPAGEGSGDTGRDVAAAAAADPTLSEPPETTGRRPRAPLAAEAREKLAKSNSVGWRKLNPA